MNQFFRNINKSHLIARKNEQGGYDVIFDIIPNEVALANRLKDQYGYIDKIIDKKSLSLVTDGLREYRKIRTKIVLKHKDLKADALAYGRACDAEKNRLISLFEPGESDLKSVKKDYDDEQAAIEQARIDDIKLEIENIKRIGFDAMTMSIDGLSDAMVTARKMEITKEKYQEFLLDAERAKSGLIASIQTAFDRQKEIEAAEQKRREDEARLAAEKAAFEKKEAERREAERVLAIEQKKLDEERVKLEAERRKIAAETAEKEKAEQVIAAEKKVDPTPDLDADGKPETPNHDLISEMHDRVRIAAEKIEQICSEYEVDLVCSDGLSIMVVAGDIMIEINGEE